MIVDSGLLFWATL